MQIKFGNITYRNDNGEVISKNEHDILRNKFQEDVDNAYNEKASQIISRIKSVATSDIEKLWMLFDYLTADNMSYNLQGTTQDGRLALDYGYSFAPYKSWKIQQGTKYPALLNNAGVCITYSLAYEDLANKLGIPCRVISGYTGMEHAWNVVLINNQVKQIDVAYAIMNKRINNKKDFFLKDTFPNRTISSDLSDLERNMKEQYAKEHPHIKIISRTDKPTIKIISRKDDNDEEPKITIHKK